MNLYVKDTVEHSGAVQVYPALGSGDLSRPSLVQAMVRGEREWDSVASFCEAVMLEETVERQSVRTSHPSPCGERGRHHGRRVSRDDSRPP
ncbi:hypothetical protein B5X24_HaOG214051 [Helicoverpa armigera]|uniref:Uncharacterized protein n=1 Tax=Helicoverpa armigera TaxID=29058 RepID=A0A2W1B801_HELAM|nr:hypothetical protein B5X24_HaOG214051 [Helicoverpa armigera]